MSVRAALYTPTVTRYWALRTDQSRRAWIWSELKAGRLRQGWGISPDDDLEVLASIRRRGGRLEGFQREVWRGNRRLLPSQPDSMQVGDMVVFMHMPRHRLWSIARVTGGYRFEVSNQANAWDGRLDYGHIRDVELLTDDRGIDPERENVSDALRRATRNRQRMWSLDDHANEIEMLASTKAARR
jgi:hypothetical protein